MYFLLYRSAKIQICIFAEPYSYLLILAETVSMGTCGNYCDICCGALLFPLYILCRNSDKIYGLSKDQHQYLCLLLLHSLYSYYPQPLDHTSSLPNIKSTDLTLPNSPFEFTIVFPSFCNTKKPLPPSQHTPSSPSSNMLNV